VQLSPHSLSAEYALFVEREIEQYKDSIPRSTLLAIGDEAVRQLGEQPQLALTELVLVEEVDRIIARRLRIPSYRAWRTRRIKQLQELQRPETWGLSRDSIVVRELTMATDAHVVIAGGHSSSALYLAAHGCMVTAINDEPALVERVMEAAAEAGLSPYVHSLPGSLEDYAPHQPVAAIVYSASTLARLPADQRERVLAAWQHATRHGGVHVVDPRELSLEELRARYQGWTVTIERDASAAETFLARKVED
jgi:hypothetical protein